MIILWNRLYNYQVFLIEKRGIDFIGYKFYCTHILLRDSIKRRFIIMMRKNRNQKSINSYMGWLKYCNSINLQKKYYTCNLLLKKLVEGM